MPTFMSRLLLGFVIILNALYLLMQRWSVAFYCYVHYVFADIKSATHVKVRDFMFSPRLFNDGKVSYNGPRMFTLTSKVYKFRLSPLRTKARHKWCP